MNILVTYDVSTKTPAGEKRLRRVAKICEDHGVRVQNSVFECTVNHAQLVMFRAALLKAMSEKEDSIRIYHLGKGFTKRVEHHGYQPPLDVNEALIV